MEQKNHSTVQNKNTYMKAKQIWESCCDAGGREDAGSTSSALTEPRLNIRGTTTTISKDLATGGPPAPSFPSQQDLGTSICPFLPPFFLLLPRPPAAGMGKERAGKTSCTSLLSCPGRKEHGARRGPRPARTSILLYQRPPRTQSELQMASGDSRGWSHVLDQQRHSCCCQKKPRPD